MNKTSYLQFDSQFKPPPVAPPQPRPRIPASGSRPTAINPGCLPDTRVPPPGHQAGQRMLQNRVARPSPLPTGPPVAMGVRLPPRITVPPPAFVPPSSPYPASFLPPAHIPRQFPASTFPAPVPHFNPSFVAPMTTGAGNDSDVRSGMPMSRRGHGAVTERSRRGHARHGCPPGCRSSTDGAVSASPGAGPCQCFSQ